MVLGALLAGAELDLERFSKPRYLELGFGQGLSLAIHAASQPGEYWGTDFNAAQANHCNKLMRLAGVNAHVFDHGFAEFASREALPQFDIIALHGIWSWITVDNRRAVLDLISRYLAPGGLLYLSYNCSPGWAPAKPLRDLMYLHHGKQVDKNLPVGKQVDQTLDFVSRAAATKVGYFAAQPGLEQRIEGMKKHNRNYLAHEYFNEEWALMGVQDVHSELSGIKLDYLCQSSSIDDDDALQMRGDALKLMSECQQPLMREVLRDFFCNRQFRQDVFVRGKHLVSPAQLMDQLLDARLMLSSPIEAVPMKLRTSVGEVSLKEEIYKPVLQAMASKDFEPKRVSELLAMKEIQAVGVQGLLQVIRVLSGTGHVHLVLSKSEQASAQSKCLNDALARSVRYNDQISTVASPTLGKGVGMSSVDILLMQAYNDGMKTPEAAAKAVLAAHDAVGRRLVKDGKPIEDRTEHLQALTAMAQATLGDRLTINQRLGLLI
jgi:SAM-dependent methyltransferase